MPLTLSISPTIVMPGDAITFTIVLDAPQKPNETGITITVIELTQNKIIGTRVIDLDANGHWEASHSHDISPNAPPGTYRFQVTASKGALSLSSNIVEVQVGVAVLPTQEMLPLVALAVVDIVLAGLYAATMLGLIKPLS